MRIDFVRARLGIVKIAGAGAPFAVVKFHLGKFTEVQASPRAPWRQALFAIAADLEEQGMLLVGLPANDVRTKFAPSSTIDCRDDFLFLDRLLDQGEFWCWIGAHAVFDDAEMGLVLEDT